MCTFADHFQLYLFAAFPLSVLYTVFRKKHPLTLYVISLWKMLSFAQNFQGIFTRKQVVRKWKKLDILCYE